MEERVLSVSEIVGACSSALEMSFERIVVEGEVASYKVNQGKFVFFDLKDEGSSLPCFMMLFAVRFPIQDGMKIRIVGTPKITTWGKFSFTVHQMIPVGEGDIKKSFEMLKRKLAGEGLFAAERKRPLPERITKIGVISSMQAAGYVDFVKILDERWGGLDVEVIHTQVQGMGAAEQIISALRVFSERGDRDVVAVIRGGGSADDLAVFNDEELVRAIAASKVPVITGVGHEVDESLADLAADMRASTPSNAAQLLTRDKRAEKLRIEGELRSMQNVVLSKVQQSNKEMSRLVLDAQKQTLNRLDAAQNEVSKLSTIVEQLSPNRVLGRGYAMVRGTLEKGGVVIITTADQEAEAEIKSVKERRR